jgi:small-conductance mechanosensitive channel
MNDEFMDQLTDVIEYTGGFIRDFAAFIAGAALFVAIIWLTSWLGGKVRRWFLRRTSDRWAHQPNATSLVDNIMRLGVFAAGLVLALGVVGVSTDSLVTWFGVIVAALSLALQDIIKNLVAGFYLLIEQPFKTGDRLIVSGHDGYVETVALRVTGLRNAKRQYVLVPNYLVFSEVVINRTALEPHCLVLTVANVPAKPDDALAGVAKAAREVLGPGAKPPAVELTTVKAETTTVNARIWMTTAATQRDPVIMAIHRAYPTAAIAVMEG